MLCCGGEKDSARDMKSAQNTPSRQPMQPPYPQTQQQQQQMQLQQQQQQQGMQLGPPPLQPNRFPPPLSQINNYPKDDYRKVNFISFLGQHFCICVFGNKSNICSFFIIFFIQILQNIPNKQKIYFDLHLVFTAPKRSSKYITHNYLF